MPIPTDTAPLLEAAFNERRADTLAAQWTEDFRFDGPCSSFVGKEAMLAVERNLWTAFPDIRTQIEPFATTDDRLAMWVRMRGTHSGPLSIGGTPVVPPSGRPIDFSLSVHLWFRDVLIARERLTYDTAHFFRQLGLLPA